MAWRMEVLEHYSARPFQLDVGHEDRKHSVESLRPVLGLHEVAPRVYRVALRDRAARVDRPDIALCRRDAFRGLPPSIPFRRDEAAFRLDRTEPRQAGQKETRSILWI